MGRLIGAVELGGTKVLAAVATDPLAPLRKVRIPTREPEVTMAAVADFLAEAQNEFGPLQGIGIGAFGPIDIRPASSHWGRLGSTPKSGWEGANPISLLRGRLNCPLSLDTDVNAAALAEARGGAGRGVGSIVYITVGTGIGGGVIIDGRSVRGAMHPEIGHVRLDQHPDDDYRSRCPFHGNCAEGLASGPAITDRFGKPLDELEAGHPFHGIFADYLGQLCATLVLVLSPHRIVIGGGVMAGASLHGAVQDSMLTRLNGYSAPPAGEGAFIVPPGLGDEAGLVGAFVLAQDLLSPA